MTENVNTAAERKQKMKRAGIAGGGLLGIGALASVALMGTGANWTDSEVVGAEFDSGSFNLQVSTDDRATWEDNDTVGTFADLDLFSGPWGPGDTDSAQFSVQLDEDTSHNASLELSSIADEAAQYGWDVEISVLEGEEWTPIDQGWSGQLDTGDFADFQVDVSFDADGDDNQGEAGDVTFTFDAESQPHDG